MNSRQNDVMKTQTNTAGVAVFYSVLEDRTNEKGTAEVNRYVVKVSHISQEETPIKNLLVKYVPAVYDKEGKIKIEQEIVVVADETVVIPKGGRTQISVYDIEQNDYMQNIKVRFITETTKPDESITETSKTESKPQETQEMQNKSFLQKIIQKLKSILWRLFKHEKK